MKDSWLNYDVLAENSEHTKQFSMGYCRNGLKCVSRLHVGFFFDGLGGQNKKMLINHPL